MPCAQDQREREKAIGVAPDNRGALMARRRKPRGSGRHAGRILIYGRSPHRGELGTAVMLNAEGKSAEDNFEKSCGEKRAARQDQEAPADGSLNAP